MIASDALVALRRAAVMRWARWVAVLAVLAAVFTYVGVLAYDVAATFRGTGGSTTAKVELGGIPVLNRSAGSESRPSPTCPAPGDRDRHDTETPLLNEACASLDRGEPAAVAVAIVIGHADSGGTTSASLSLQLTVPTTSWPVRLVREDLHGASAQVFGEFLTRGLLYPDGWIFQPPRLLQSAISAESTAPAPQSVVAVTGTLHVPGYEPNFYIDVEPGVGILASTFSVAVHVAVNAGSARLASVFGQAQTTQSGQSLTATLTSRENLSVKLDIPVAAAYAPTPARRHTGPAPNWPDADPLIFAVIYALDVFAVLWALRRWRTKPEGRAVGTHIHGALRSAAWLTVLVGIAVGLFGATGQWEARAAGNRFFADIPVDQMLAGLMTPVVVVGIYRLARSEQLTRRLPASRFWSAAWSSCLTLALLVAAVMAWAVIAHVPAESGSAWPSSHGSTLIALGCGLGALAVIGTTALAQSRFKAWGVPLRISGAIGLGLVLALALLLSVEAAAVFAWRGPGSIALVTVVPVAMAAVGYAVTGEYLLAAFAGTSIPSPTAGPIRRSVSRGWFVHICALVFAAIMVWPGRRVSLYGNSSTPRLSWFAVEQFFGELGSLLHLVVLALLMQTMRIVSTRTDAYRQLWVVRLLAGAFVVLVWAPTASWWYLPLGFLVSVIAIRFVLLPRRSLATARTLARLVNHKTQPACIAQLVNRSTLDAALTTKITEVLNDAATSADDHAFAQGLKQADMLQTRRSTLSAVRVEGAPANLTLEDLAFGYPAGTSAWSRAVAGLRASTVASLPWILLSIHADAGSEFGHGYIYVLGNLTTSIIFSVIWWATLGFIFGWAYPLIRGRNGFQKSLWMGGTISLPLLTVLLFPGPATRHHVVTTVQTISELIATLLVLGLLADYKQLRDAGFFFADLKKLRRLSGAVTWVTSVVAAVGTAVSTIIVGGATGLLAYLTPQNQHTQPPNSATNSEHRS
jgi:hypothetical protein